MNLISKHIIYIFLLIFLSSSISAQDFSQENTSFKSEDEIINNISSVIPSVYYRNTSIISDIEKQSRLDFCEMIEDEGSKSQCIHSIALDSLDSDFCSQTIISDSCYESIAKVSCNVEICKSMSSLQLRNSCMARTSNFCFDNIPLINCYDFEEDYLIDACLFNIFLDTRYVVYNCNQTIIDMEECGDYYYVSDKSLCEDISQIYLKNRCNYVADNKLYNYFYLLVSLISIIFMFIFLFFLIKKIFDLDISKMGATILGFLFWIIVNMLPDYSIFNVLFYYTSILSDSLCPSDYYPCIDGWFSPSILKLFIMFIVIPSIYIVLALFGHMVYKKISHKIKE